MLTRLRLITIATLAFSAPHALAAGNSSGPNSPIVVGRIVKIVEGGTRLVVQTSKITRELKISDHSKIEYISIPNPQAHTPTVGFGLKARVKPGDTIELARLTLPIPETKPLGQQRLTLSAHQLFQHADINNDARVTYTEFSAQIYRSDKHGPDKFVKYDTDHNGAYNGAEFKHHLAEINWWALSRHTPAQWMTQADTDRNQQLDPTEFATLCSSANHLEAIFERNDLDRSGALSLKETTAYLRNITHGK